MLNTLPFLLYGKFSVPGHAHTGEMTGSGEDDAGRSATQQDVSGDTRREEESKEGKNSTALSGTKHDEPRAVLRHF